jgi:hypothetical protein
MPSRFDHSLHVGLSMDGVALAQRTGWWRPRATVLGESPALAGRFDSHQLPLHQLRTLLTDAGRSNQAATVVVADAWARYFMVTPPRNAARLDDCRAAAELRFQGLYGEAASGWQVEADWNARHPFLACAMPLPLLAGLQQVGAEYRLRLTAVQPHFTLAWNRWRHQLPPDAWFGTIGAESLTLGIRHSKRLLAVRTLALPAVLSDDRRWLVTQLAREALRLNLPAPERIHVAGPVPGAWPAPDDGPPDCSALDGDPDQALGAAASEAAMLAMMMGTMGTTGAKR